MAFSQTENPPLAWSPVRGATFWRVREYPDDRKACLLESRLSRRTAIDVQDFTSDECRFFQIRHRIENFFYLSHSAHGLGTGKIIAHLWRMHRRPDDAWRDRVYPDAPAGIFNGERASNGIEAAFHQNGKGRRKRRHRLFGDRCRDVDDVAGANSHHPGRSLLRNVEEPRQI